LPKVTEAYKEEKRISILEGALHCFAEKGYRDTTINEIASYMLISKGAIYIYFTSKEDIYRQLMEYRMRKMLEETSQVYESIPTATEKLLYLIHRFTKQQLSDLRRLLSFHLEFMLNSSRQMDMKRVMDKHSESAVEFVSEVIAEGKKSGEFRSDINEASAAALFWAVRDGIALQSLHENDEAKYMLHMNEMEKMVFSYLRPDQAAKPGPNAHGANNGLVAHP